MREGKFFMKESLFRRSLPLFSIGIVMELTGLTARQIRYYEEHQLISPSRTNGKHRLFSLNDIDKLLEIKDLLNQGLNIAGIKKVFAMKEKQQNDIGSIGKDVKARHDLSESELRKMLRSETLLISRYNQISLRQGDLSRFLQ